MRLLFVETLQVRIQAVPVLDKLQYLYRLLSSVLPVIKQIHLDQCTELELEKRLRGEPEILFRVTFDDLYCSHLFLSLTLVCSTLQELRLILSGQD